MPELWTLSELAESMSVNRTTVLAWLSSESFPEPFAESVGGTRLWEAEKVRDWRRGVIRERREKMAF